MKLADLRTTAIVDELDRRLSGGPPFYARQFITASLTRELVRRLLAHREACRRGGSATGPSKSRTHQQAVAAGRAAAAVRWQAHNTTSP